MSMMTTKTFLPLERSPGVEGPEKRPFCSVLRFSKHEFRRSLMMEDAKFRILVMGTPETNTNT